MKFNLEEINLCKQVAEKYRKEIELGAFVVYGGNSCLVIGVGKNYIAVKWLKSGEQLPVIYTWTTKKYVTPLWTISDCLEFLREEGFMVRLIEYENHSGEKRIECNCYGHKTKGAFSTQGSKDEEACLKAVLVVVEENKK